MLFSRANMAVAAVASRKAREPALSRVHLAEDGSSVASDGRAIMAVGPVDEERAATHPNLGDADADVPEGGVGVSLRIIEKVVRDMPTERRPSLQFARLTKCEQSEIEMTTTNGASRTKRDGMPMRGTFPKWRGIIGGAMRRARRGRVCVDRKALIRLLQAMDRAAPDRGNFNAVFLEFGGPEDHVVLRAENYEMRQRVVGMIKPLDTKGQWLNRDDEWEQELAKVGASEMPERRRRG